MTYSKGAADGTETAPTETPKAPEEIVTVQANPFTYTGYTFTGWKRSDNGEIIQPDDSFNMPNVDVTLTAQWEAVPTPVTYTVTYALGEGTGTAPTDSSVYASGDSVTVADSTGITAPADKHFSVWKDEATGNTFAAGGTMIMGGTNLVLTAQFEDDAPKYTITYNVDGTTTIDTTTYAENAEYTVDDTIPGAPAKTGFVFTGWRNSVDDVVYVSGAKFLMPAQNVTLIATWVAEDAVFQVTYDVDGDTSVFIDANDYKFAATVKIADTNAPTKTDYTFAGWKRSDNGEILNAGDSFNMPACNLTLTAQWNSITKYAFTYDLNGAAGTLTDANSPYVSGANVTVEDIGSITYDGYVFEGWNTAADGSGISYQPGNVIVMPEEPVVLYAQWAKTYTVKFDLGAGAGQNGNPTTIADQIVVLGDKLTSVGAIKDWNDGGAPAKDYFFGGWKNQNGKMWSFDNDEVNEGCFDGTGTMTLTAQWDTIQHYNIIFSADNLNDYDPNLVDYVYYKVGSTYHVYTDDGAWQVASIASNASINSADRPTFSRVDYTFEGWYLDTDYLYAFDASKKLDNATADNLDYYAAADNSVTVYAKWAPNFDSSDDVAIKAESLTLDGLYNSYYSDFVEAYKAGTFNPVPVYRNFMLTGGALPTGLYLNSRTGEIYGVPTEAGEYTFQIQMVNDDVDGYGDRTVISAPVEFTMTIAKRDVDIDHSDLTYSKIYGDAELSRNGAVPTPAIVEADMLSGHYDATSTSPIITNDNLIVDVEAAATDVLSVYPDVYTPGIQEDSDEYIFDYDYAAFNTDRTTKAGTFTPKEVNATTPSATLKYAPDLDAAHVVPANLRDKIDAVQLHREIGEDAGSYKIYMGDDDYTMQRRIGGSYFDNSNNYNVTIAEAFAKTTLDYDENEVVTTADKYVFVIDKATLTIGLTGYNPTKTYGDDDPTFVVDGMTLSVANAANGVVPTTGTKEIVVDFTGTGDAGFKDTITVELQRKPGEDAGDYQIFLADEKVTGKETTKSTAPDPDSADPLVNYNVVINDNIKEDDASNNNKLTVNNRATTYTVDGTPFTYGTIKPGDAVTGSHSDLADNAGITVVDEDTSVTISDALTASTSGYVVVGTYTAADAAFVMTNTAWVDDGTSTATELTAGNYTVTSSFVVDPLALTMGSVEAINKVATTFADADVAKLTPAVTGIIEGDDVTVAYTYWIDINADSVVDSGEEFDEAGILAGINALTNADTYNVKVTVALSGADAGNYTAPAAQDTTIDVTKITLTPAGATKNVNTGASVTAADVTALLTLNGKVSGDDVSATVTSYDIDLDNSGSVEPAEQFSDPADAAAGLTTLAADVGAYKVTINYTTVLTGANADKYEIAAAGSVDATLNVTVYVAPPAPPAPTYTITVSAGEGGTISPNTCSVSKNSSKTFTITANDGYAIRDVLVDGVSVGALSTYVFESVDADHTIEAEFKAVPALNFGCDDCDCGLSCVLHQFSDLDSNAWYHDGVHFCIENGIMNGIGNGLFKPNATTTRAMIITMLYRLEGSPVVVGTCKFTDVEEGSWYEDAVIWAQNNNVTKGYPDDTFGVEDPVTREQLAAFIYNYAQYKGYDVTNVDETAFAAFPDAARVSEYAQTAMKWAVSAGIINGVDGSLLPGSSAERCQAASMLLRFYKWIYA